MSVKLVNASGRLKTFVLSHEAYCKALGRCACTIQPGRDRRRIAGSITLAAGAMSEPLDDAVLVVRELERAVRSGELRVER